MSIGILGASSANTNYADVKSMGMKSNDQELQEIAAVFSAMMNQQPDLSAGMTDFSTSDNSVEGVNSSSAVSNSYERYSYKEYHVDEAKPTDFSEKLEEVSEELQEFEQEALDAISEEFGVEKEEIMAVLEEMGLSIMDLLNPQNLVSFVMELTGVATKEELLLNDSFLSIMNTMDAMKKDLMKALDVTQEGLDQLVELMQPVEETKVSEEIEVSQEMLTEAQEESEVSEEDIVNIVEMERESISETNTSKSKQHQSMDSNQQSGESFMTMTSNVNATQALDATSMSSYLSANTMEIMEQVVEHIKLNVTAETKTMEMQLNPENLGKIHISISEENGVINAQFTATSEIVKEALESQLATLRENLNQAGVKVDAIEVTVQTHQFESNLEQNHKREENEGAYKEELTQKRRNLNINSLDELSGLMTEEEALVAQIMKDNGNSVDLTA